MRSRTITKFLATLVLLSIIIGASFFLFSLTHQGIANTISDYISFATGGLMVKDGAGNKIYDLETQSLYQNNLLAPHSIGGVLPFKSPPFVALLYLPFAYFSLVTGYKLFVITNLILIGVFTYLSAKTFPAIRRFGFWFLIPFLFLSSTQTIFVGQFSFILVLLTLALFIQVKSKKAFTAGVVCALLIMKPQYIVAAPFFLIFFKDKIRFLVGYFSTLMLLILISITISGTEAMLSYPSFLLYTETPTYGSNVEHMFTLNSTLLSIPVVKAYGYGHALVFGSAFYFLALYLFIKRHNLVKHTQLFVSATIFFLLFAVHVQSHDLSIFLVPLFLILQAAVSNKGGSKNLLRFFAFGLFLIPYIVLYISPAAATLIALVLAVGVLFLNPKMFKQTELGHYGKT